MDFWKLPYIEKMKLSKTIFQEFVYRDIEKSPFISSYTLDELKAITFNYYFTTSTPIEKKDYELAIYRYQNSLFRWYWNHQELDPSIIVQTLYEKKIPLTELLKIDYRLSWYGTKQREYQKFHKIYSGYQLCLKSHRIKTEPCDILNAKEEAKMMRVNHVKPFLEYFVSDENPFPISKYFNMYYHISSDNYVKQVQFYGTYNEKWKQKYNQIKENLEENKKRICNEVLPMIELLEDAKTDTVDIIDYYQTVQIPFSLLKMICTQCFTRKECEILDAYYLVRNGKYVETPFTESMYEEHITIHDHVITMEEKEEALFLLETAGIPINSLTYHAALNRMVKNIPMEKQHQKRK